MKSKKPSERDSESLKEKKIPWNEHLSLVSDKSIDIVKGIDIKEDIQREV